MSGSKVEVSWFGVVLQCSDGPAVAHFYERLLGWTVFEESRDWTTLAESSSAGFNLAFTTEDDYVRPVWPTEPGKRPMMAHLDLEVAELDPAVERARALGAELAEFQPQDDVRVMFDPDGHPFCFYLPHDQVG